RVEAQFGQDGADVGDRHDVSPLRAPGAASGRVVSAVSVTTCFHYLHLDGDCKGVRSLFLIFLGTPRNHAGFPGADGGSGGSSGATHTLLVQHGPHCRHVAPQVVESRAGEPELTDGRLHRAAVTPERVAEKVQGCRVGGSELGGQAAAPHGGTPLVSTCSHPAARSASTVHLDGIGRREPAAFRRSAESRNRRSSRVGITTGSPSQPEPTSSPSSSTISTAPPERYGFAIGNRCTPSTTDVPACSSPSSSSSRLQVRLRWLRDS